MKALSDLDYDELLVRAVEAARLPDLPDDAELRVDLNPLSEGGKHYWTKGEGLAKWATHAHPWTALYHHILKWKGMTPAYAKRIAGEWYYEVFGHGPTAGKKRSLDADDEGDDYAGLDVLDDGTRSDYGAIAVTTDAWLRERANMYLRGLPDAPRPIDALRTLDDDERELVLLTALYEFDLESRHVRAFDPSKHRRWPKGTPNAGKFRPMVDLLKQAIAEFDPKMDKHPFIHFSRPQLLKAARDRGISINRGEHEDSIAAKILADLGGPKAATPSKAASGVTTKPGPKWHNGDATTEVHVGGDQLGIVVHSSKTGGYFPFIPSGSKKTPLGNMVRVQPGAGSGYQSEQSAVDAIVRAHTPSKVSGPGLAGLNLTELRIEPMPDPGTGVLAKTSWEISGKGSPIGTVHDRAWGWEARDPQGKRVTTASAWYFGTKSEALQALAATPAAARPKTKSAPTTPSTPSTITDPALADAIAVIYGQDPKARTAARQMAVYGVLRRDQFDQLGPAERSVVLGDLSFVMTTSKDPKAQNRARTIFSRFTPPGTPPGSVPAQMALPPTTSVAGQTHFPDPGGVKGMLKKSKNPGQSGDGWTRLANGGTGPWGKYGAAGLLLRHVDQKDGKERFLMVQRGPGISDPGKWQFPGGAIDSKESPAEGATREVLEELGFKESDFTDARVHGFHEAAVPGAMGWKYTSIAATVPTRLKPDLSTHHAQMETADAKWMTIDEIRKLDGNGKLLKPLAGGEMERNVVSLFPSGASTGAGAPGIGPVTKKLPRLSGTPQVAAAQPPAPHKPSTGKNLIADKAAQDKLRADVAAVRKSYRGKTADERLAAIGAMQGFDATPTVASKDEMDHLLATGDYIEVWRGVTGKAGKSAASINEDMRSGPAFYGLGVFGNGYYLATDKAIAQRYADGSRNSLLRILIPKAAKTDKHKNIASKARSATSSTSYYHQGRQSMGGGTLHDEGRYAAAAGLDGIEISKQEYQSSGGYGHLATGAVYNWINRSVLIVQEAQ